jgi:futalosine hydrolase
MKILIVAATLMEVKLLVDDFEFVNEKSHNFNEYRYEGIEIDVLITGIGTTFAAFHVTEALRQNDYWYVINTGIAGSFTSDLQVGEVVNVVSEEFADLGIEEKDRFLTLFESGYMDSNEFPFENGLLKAGAGNGSFNFKNVRGITANIIHGKFSSISAVKEKFSAHIESTEGAAVLFVCNWLGVPCFEIRAISNYVEPREPAQWNIPLSLENLKNAVFHVLKEVTVPVH